MGRCCYSHDTTIKFAYLFQPFTRIECLDCQHIQVRTIHDLLTTRMKLILPELTEMYIELRLRFTVVSPNF